MPVRPFHAVSQSKGSSNVWGIWFTDILLLYTKTSVMFVLSYPNCSHGLRRRKKGGGEHHNSLFFRMKDNLLILLSFLTHVFLHTCHLNNMDSSKSKLILPP